MKILDNNYVQMVGRSKRINMTEARLQQECFMHFNNNYPSLRGLFFKIKNEGTNKITGARDKATGLVSGVADSCLLIPDEKPVFIEFKTQKGRQSEAQKEWENKVINAGYMYAIVNTIEGFHNLCKLLLN